MINEIQQFIESVPHDLNFDTHTVIEFLIKNHSDIYLSNYCRKSTELYHGYIGQVIKDNFASSLVMQIGESWSKNIHDGYSKCTLWKRV